MIPSSEIFLHFEILISRSLVVSKPCIGGLLGTVGGYFEETLIINKGPSQVKSLQVGCMVAQLGNVSDRDAGIIFEAQSFQLGVQNHLEGLLCQGLVVEFLEVSPGRDLRRSVWPPHCRIRG